MLRLKFGFNNRMVWHNDNELPKSDLVVLPGFFLWGLSAMRVWLLNQR